MLGSKVLLLVVLSLTLSEVVRGNEEKTLSQMCLSALGQENSLTENQSNGCGDGSCVNNPCCPGGPFNQPLLNCISLQMNIDHCSFSNPGCFDRAFCVCCKVYSCCSSSSQN